MAFYKDVPGKRPQKRNYGEQGSWDDEGSHYRGAVRQFGPGAGERVSDRPRRPGGDFRDGRVFSRQGEQPRQDRHDDRRPGSGAPRFDARRPESRPGPDRHDDRRPGSGAPRFDARRPEGRPGPDHYGDHRPGSGAPRFDARRPEGRPGPDRYGDHRPGSGAPRFDARRPEGRPGPDRYGDHRPDSGAPRFDARRPQSRPVAPASEKRDYHDFEFRSAVTPVETESVQPNENLLAGRNPIREALKSGRDIEKLLVQKGELSGSAREIVQMAREAHVPVQEVEKIRLDEIAPHHQGMLAFASAYQYSTVDAMLDDAKAKNQPPFLILLDGVTDPHNLGAIIRTAECAGAHGVIVPERRSVGLTPAAVKASAGAIEHMKVARVVNLNRTIEELKAQGVWLYAVTMDGEDYEKADFKGGVALVIGAEGEGISRLTLEMCDHKVSLPMEGCIDSLNASVAAGVMMYRVLASRKA